MLVFKNDFEALFQQNPSVIPEKRQELRRRSTSACNGARRPPRRPRPGNAFQELSFILELLHYYENQNTEAPEVPFAQRLPVLIEQLVVASGREKLEEKLIVHAEELLARHSA